MPWKRSWFRLKNCLPEPNHQQFRARLFWRFHNSIYLQNLSIMTIFNSMHLQTHTNTCLTVWTKPPMVTLRVTVASDSITHRSQTTVASLVAWLTKPASFTLCCVEYSGRYRKNVVLILNEKKHKYKKFF